jgi:hypothetical protein
MGQVNSYVPAQATPQPSAQQSAPFGGQQQLSQTTYPHGYGTASATPYPRNTIQQHQAAQNYAQQQQSNIQDRRAPEAYVLSDTANESIPKDIRDQFPQDDHGRVLFFTRPPIDTRHMITGRTASDKGKPLMHTTKYLEAKEARDKLLSERKRSASDMNGEEHEVNGTKRAKQGHFGEERDADGRIRVNEAAAAEMSQARLKDQEEAAQLQLRAIKKLEENMRRGTVEEYLRRYGKNALDALKEDQARAMARVRDEEQRAMMLGDLGSKGDDIVADTKRLLSQNRWTGRYADGTGRFEDDFDNRLPR